MADTPPDFVDPALVSPPPPREGVGAPMAVPYVPGAGRASLTGPWQRRNWRAGLLLWWREIDRVLLVMVLALMGLGSLAVAAASPASARKLSTAAVHFDDLHFFFAHLRFLALGMVLMFASSQLSRQNARRIGIVLGGLMLCALVLVPVLGTSHNGSKRWLLGTSFQPSEFMKPAFAIMLAWILSWKGRDGRLPVMMICSGLMAVMGVLLMAQPDFGSTVLFGFVWFVLMFLSGLPLRWVGGAAAGGLVVLGLAYEFYANARNRIDNFLSGGTAFDQVDIARHALLGGGWTGTGLWLGTKKLGLPEAHTDYIFSVVGEEFGLLTCAVIVVLYLGIVWRVIRRLTREDEDQFTVLAGTGLVAQLGGQAFINILVNLQLFPSKGMTLPLISYGGSSTIALCLTVGFLLAITRRNPYLHRDPFARPAGHGGPAAGPGPTGRPQ